MRLNGNAPANGSAPMPPLMTDPQRELGVQHEFDERPQRERLSDILTRANQTPDGTQQLKEIVAGITREPKAAINEIEQEIASLRGQIAVREQTLVEAIDQHANLSKEAVRGMGCSPPGARANSRCFRRRNASDPNRSVSESGQ